MTRNEKLAIINQARIATQLHWKAFTMECQKQEPDENDCKAFSRLASESAAVMSAFIADLG